MTSFSHAQMRAAIEFGTAVITVFDQGGTFPAEVAIGSAARMAGSFLLRSFALGLTGIQPGSVVLSEEVNQQGLRLAQIMDTVLEETGVKLDSLKLSAIQRMTKRQKATVLETQRILEAPFAAIRRKYGLNDAEAADSVAVATATLITHWASLLDAHVAFGLAVYGIIEGCKTAPAVFDSP